MKKEFYIIFSWCIISMVATGQNIGIGTTTPHASSALDITSTTKGLLIPRMTSTGITAIPNPAKGLMVYDSVQNILMVNMGRPATPNWQTIAASNGWSLTGNNGTDTAVNFIGTTDGQPLIIKINNQWAGIIDSASMNTAIGYGAGKNNSNPSFNTATGFKALNASALYYNFYGLGNTANGAYALYSNKDGSYNTANGAYSLYSNQQGFNNTANGAYSLYLTNGGKNNTASGFSALYNNSSGSGNTATGMFALYHNISGNINTANGYAALYFNTDGAYNTGIGNDALYSNTIGTGNTATGAFSLYNNTTASYNTAAGFYALFANTTGNFNVADGYTAQQNNTYGSQNTAIGFSSLQSTTGSDGNTALGFKAGTTYDNGYYNCFIGSETDAAGPGFYNTIALGHGTIVTAPNMMRVGNGATTSIGGPVGWSTISDERVKKNIQQNVPGLDFINKLRPVSYNIDLTAMDRIIQPASPKNNAARVVKANVPQQMSDALKAKEQIVYTGFMAQEVELAAKAMHYNFSGVDTPKNDKDLYSLRYADFVAPLVKAVQELSGQNEQLKKDNELLIQQKEDILKRLAAIEKRIQ
ncbi:MAG: tail fiber domain-containing protein [Bacteroidota bacterium]